MFGKGSNILVANFWQLGQQPNSLVIETEAATPVIPKPFSGLDSEHTASSFCANNMSA
jgi:hypothetical protein